MNPTSLSTFRQIGASLEDTAASLSARDHRQIQMALLERERLQQQQQQQQQHQSQIYTEIEGVPRREANAAARFHSPFGASRDVLHLPWFQQSLGTHPPQLRHPSDFLATYIHPGESAAVHRMLSLRGCGDSMGVPVYSEETLRLILAEKASHEELKRRCTMEDVLRLSSLEGLTMRETMREAMLDGQAHFPSGTALSPPPQSTRQRLVSPHPVLSYYQDKVIIPPPPSGTIPQKLPTALPLTMYLNMNSGGDALLDCKRKADSRDEFSAASGAAAAKSSKKGEVKRAAQFPLPSLKGDGYKDKTRLHLQAYNKLWNKLSKIKTNQAFQKEVFLRSLHRNTPLQHAVKTRSVILEHSRNGGETMRKI